MYMQPWYNGKNRQVGCIHVLQFTCINMIHVSSFSDPFVKVYLMQNNRKVSKKKTTIKRGERNPIFNEAMIFSVPSSTLSVRTLVLVVQFHLIPIN